MDLRFPLFRKVSARHGYGGHGGVPVKDANGETANSWEYCRQWIDRVEPLFVCILGQRYSWVPEPEQLPVRDGLFSEACAWNLKTIKSAHECHSEEACR